MNITMRSILTLLILLALATLAAVLIGWAVRDALRILP